MKRIFIILIVFITVNCLNAQSIFEAHEKETVKNNQLRKKIQMDQKYVNGELSSEGYISSITKYDENGNVLEIINYRSNGNIISVINNKYDKNGNKLEYTRYKGNRETVTYRQRYVYDEKGQKIEENGFDGASNFKTTYAYNDNGKLKSIHYYTGATLTDRREFIYEGTNLTVNVYDSEDKKQAYYKRIFDSKDQLIDDSKYDMEDNLLNRVTYTYDNNGNVIVETKFNSGNVCKMINKYNDNFYLNEVTKEDSEESFVTNKYIYDENGNLVEELWKKFDSREYSRKTYTYDKEGKCTSIDCYFASYKFKVFYSLSYEM